MQRKVTEGNKNLLSWLAFIVISNAELQGHLVASVVPTGCKVNLTY